MPELSSLREALASVRRMDRLNFLEHHLDRAHTAIEALLVAPGREDATGALSRFKLQLDNYYHFLARLSPEQEFCSSLLEWMRDCSGDEPHVSEAKRLIETEFEQSRVEFVRQVRGAEGSALLAWVHTARYYISRTKQKGDDLRLWAGARAVQSEARVALKDFEPESAGCPELVSQVRATFNRLEVATSKPWSFGRGREVSVISTRLDGRLSALKACAAEASRLRAAVTTLAEKLPPEIDPAARSLLIDIRGMKPLPVPRLRVLFEEVSEFTRKSEVMGKLEGVGRRRHAVSPASETHWVESLSGANASLAGVHLLAGAMMKVLPSIKPLLRGLRNEEQRQELLSRRESLLQTLIEANLVHGATPYAALVHLSWYALRLTTAPERGRCTRFGEAILKFDTTLQCPECSEHCHAECLVKGRCPVDGYIISQAEYDLHYPE